MTNLLLLHENALIMWFRRGKLSVLTSVSWMLKSTKKSIINMFICWY
jgi:hypothetical protein